jgi:hypothetical protein
MVVNNVHILIDFKGEILDINGWNHCAYSIGFKKKKKKNLALEYEWLWLKGLLWFIISIVMLLLGLLYKYYIDAKVVVL